MSRTRTALAAGLTLLATAGLPAVTTGGASAATGTLHVDRAPGANCSNSGSGTAAQPFCTVAAAAAVASAGQTVEIAWGTYPEDLVITRSGRQGAPIVFRGKARGDGSQDAVLIGAVEGPSNGIKVRGAEFVEFENLGVVTNSQALSVTVDGAKQVKFTAVHAFGALLITNGSRQVTYARSNLNGTYGKPGVTVDGGSTGVVVTTNTVFAGYEGRPSVLVDGAPGTVVVSNTVYADCATGIALDGASAGAVVKNNVVDTARSQNQRCADTAAATGISVAPTATDGTVVDYNVVDPRSDGAPYRWADTAFPSQPEFTAGTGQGAHDFVAKVYEPRSPDGPQAASTDSADETAPGMLPVDRIGDGPADDPTVRNTGTGKGYRDRGAVESRDFGSVFTPAGPVRLLDTREAVGVPGTEAVPAGGTVDLQVAGEGGAPLDGVTAVTMNVTVTDPSEDGHLRVHPHGTALTQTSSLNWTAGRTVPNLVTVPVKDGKVSFYNSSGGTVHLIADLAGYYSAEGRLTFTPNSPWRAMDTRQDVRTECCLRPAGTVGAFDALDVEIHAPNIAAATLNVTVTEPGTDGHLIVYPGTELMPAVSNLNFQAGETVANQVVVKVNEGHITIRNASAAPVHIIVDLFGTQSY
ncbi:hypothetical protein ACFC58_23170 [Kitasatospora purpeofusca]|uniref:hypothetical protein n=1 Tax=Kitasatospora purpeofusca TaxID=67352 RepID=UPI0035DD7EC2